MGYVNGATTEATIAPRVLTGQQSEANAQGEQFPPERLDQIKSQLEEPFDPTEIKWRVTATSTQQTKRGPQKRGQLVAYADQRAYTDRLNQVFGEWGWTRDYNVQVAQNFERRSPGDKAQTSVAAKVVVVSRVTIHGLGTHTGVGEEWADDQNAATRAEAQAFKRACACFGLGRYLYDLETTWADLDQYNRPVETPSLPDWARPGYAEREAQRRQQQEAHRKNQPRQGLVQQEMLAKVGELCQKVGHSLSQFVLKTYGGATDPAKVGFAKLTTVFERLSDMANGIERLRRAAGVLGSVRYSAICKELNFASDSIDDIPDRSALKLLLARVEAEATAKDALGQRTTANAGGAIAEARGRLLQAARKVAESRRKEWPEKLGEVIVKASDGRLSLDSLKDLTDAEVPIVKAAISVLEGGVH
jgi:hypothetical protein